MSCHQNNYSDEVACRNKPSWDTMQMPPSFSPSCQIAEFSHLYLFLPPPLIFPHQPKCISSRLNAQSSFKKSPSSHIRALLSASSVSSSTFSTFSLTSLATIPFHLRRCLAYLLAGQVSEDPRPRLFLRGIQKRDPRGPSSIEMSFCAQ